MRRSVLIMLVALGCCGGDRQSSHPRSRVAFAATERSRSAAVAALRDGRFRTAERHAELALAADRSDATSAAVRAMSRYLTVGETFAAEVEEPIALLFEEGRGIEELVGLLERTEAALAVVAKDLEVAAAEPTFHLELCIACWRHDWNRNGDIDPGDERLLEVEYDGRGGTFPSGDPRRRPTFRFDHGDVLWALAMVSFQRAVVDLGLAYEWHRGIRKLLRSPSVLEIPLRDAGRVEAARRLILEGLAFAQQSRAAYLAETDDDREWLPNPRQRDHPLPLPVDHALFRRWGMLLTDLDLLIRDRQALAISEIAELAGARWWAEDAPVGLVRVGRFFSYPQSIVIDVQGWESLEGVLRSDKRDEGRVQEQLRFLLGSWYSRSADRSPLLEHLLSMRTELERGEDSLETKLRYLLWLN